MAVNNVVNQDENGNRFETAKEIEINRSIVKFGTSVYQFKNVTGFEVGMIPRGKFPFQRFVILIILGLASFATPSGASVGVILLCIAGGLFIFLYIFYLGVSTRYGLTIYLNSGQKSIFVSRDKDFLMAIVENLYMFMQKEQAKSLLIDMSNRSITVGGSIGGSATAGDRNWM